jgi:hypothetical protein
MHAWSKIKAPYKELMTLLINSPAHVIFCGRQGNAYETDDETEELKMVGVKMKAEGETPYEPHILIRMECLKDKKGNGIIQAFAEKDRTGVLQGRTIQWPNFDNLCAPILPLLGGAQAQVASESDVSTVDAEKRTQEEQARAESSLRVLQKFKARIDLSETLPQLKEVGADITPAIKRAMRGEDVAELRKAYQNAEAKLSGRPVATASDEIPY